MAVPAAVMAALTIKGDRLSAAMTIPVIQTATSTDRSNRLRLILSGHRMYIPRLKDRELKKYRIADQDIELYSVRQAVLRDLF
jgi:hypothetical protein